LYDNNSVKTFSCNVCKQSKFILKKNTSDPNFKCEECIQKKEDSTSLPTPTFNPDVTLNMPASTPFQASPAMLTADGMYQPYQQYQQPQQQQPLETTPQFTWRWFNFFV